MSRSTELLRVATCPHCWTHFPPHSVLWISEHEDLRGDPRLGYENQQRFLPTRFNIDGNAIDGRGFVCHKLACPHCHLEIPRATLETEPLYVSILGAPASGKSFFLGAMSWEMRRLLPKAFGVGFSDADTIANQSLAEYEEAMFLNQDPNRLVPLSNLIRKTEEQGGGKLYDTVAYGNQSITYPRPFLFSIRPQSDHPLHGHSGKLQRIVCLYDNAGESFHIGKDSTSNPVTRHMAVARVLLFLFDPLQDARFQQLARKSMPQLFANVKPRTTRQESILQEAAVRVRRALSLSTSARHRRPLIVVVTKCDTWLPLTGVEQPGYPWKKIGALYALDRGAIEQRSRQVRAFLQSVCGELVGAAEDFAEEVLYVPISALGRAPEYLKTPEGQIVSAIRPVDIRPAWITVPLLYGISRSVSGLLDGVVRRSAKQASPAVIR